MTAAYFEDHPTDPEKVILRKPPLDQGADYERGFIDGMQKQMQSSVDKAVNAMSQRTERPVDCERCNRLEEHAYDLIGKLRVANIKLSTQPQRTWVGLTANELSMIGDSMKTWNSFSITDVYFAIEAKLKELNT